MTIAFDASTVTGTVNGSDFTISHTPVGTPKGVLVLISDTANADTITGVTYGGDALTELTNSPAISVGEEASLHAYFLGSGVATGTQDAVISVSGSSLRGHIVITLTGAADLEVNIDSVLFNTSFDSTPTANLALSSIESFVCELWMTGKLGIGDIAPLSGWSNTAELDAGARVVGSYIYDTIGTVDVTCGYSAGGDDALCYAIAINEGEASTDPIIDDVNADENIDDAETGISLDVSNFDNDITEVKLISGSAETTVLNLSGSGDSYTFDNVDVAAYTSDTVGAPLTSTNNIVQIEVTDGTDTEVLTIQSDPKANWDLTEITSASKAAGSYFLNVVETVPDKSLILAPDVISFTSTGILSHSEIDNIKTVWWNFTTKVWKPITINISTAALTGTVTASITEDDIAAGGKTIILTLTGDTWLPAGAEFNAQRQAILDGLDGS